MGLFSCGSTRNYLKDFGYGTIALPREGIKPLLMLIKNGGRLTPLGPLSESFLAGSSPLPAPSRKRSATVSGSRSTKVDLDIGLNIVGTVIGALAGSALGLKAAYKNARKVEFEFGDVMEESINITALDRFLSNGSVASDIGNFVKEMLEKDEVYVIVSTLDAKQISVAATSETGASVGLDIPVIQQIVGGKIGVSGSGASNSKVTYSSTDTPLSFGLQVLRLVIDRGKFTTLKEVKPQAAPAFAKSTTKSKAKPAIVAPDVPVEV